MNKIVVVAVGVFVVASGRGLGDQYLQGTDKASSSEVVEAMEAAGLDTGPEGIRQLLRLAANDAGQLRSREATYAILAVSVVKSRRDPGNCDSIRALAFGARDEMLRLEAAVALRELGDPVAAREALVPMLAAAEAAAARARTDYARRMAAIRVQTLAKEIVLCGDFGQWERLLNQYQGAEQGMAEGAAVALDYIATYQAVDKAQLELLAGRVRTALVQRGNARDVSLVRTLVCRGIVQREDLRGELERIARRFPEYAGVQAQQLLNWERSDLCVDWVRAKREPVCGEGAP